MRLLLLTLALSFTLPAFAAPKKSAAKTRASQPSCSELYALTAEQLAEIKPEFLKAHNGKYSIEVDTTPVRNQCQYGSCWIYGPVADLETRILAEKGIKVDLSEQYVILQSLKERIDYVLPRPGGQLEEAGFADIADRIISAHGILPAEVWQPRVPFETDPHKKRLMSFLQNRIGRYHEDVANHAGEPERLLKEARADIDAILDAYIGKPPKSFRYKGVKYSGPEDFAKRFLPERAEPILMTPDWGGLPESLMKIRPTKGNNKPAGARGPKQDLTVSMDRMEKAIVDSLKQGKPVPFAAELAKEFIDNKTGIMSIAAFHTPPGFKPASYSYRQYFDITGGGHAMIIVGADLDESGKVIKFKVKNSWGDKNGEDGIYHMYRDYFRAYMIGAQIR